MIPDRDLKVLLAADAPISSHVAAERAAHEAEIYALQIAVEAAPRVITRVMDDGIETKDGAG